MINNGHLIDEEIALFADAAILGSLESVPDNIKSHIRDCDECADKVLAVMEISEDIMSDEKYIKTKKYNFTSQKYILRIAASVLLIFSIGIIYQQIKKYPQLKLNTISETIDSTVKPIDSLNQGILPEHKVITKNDSGKIKKQLQETSENTLQQNKNLLAYAENVDLEKLVKRYTDSSLRGEFNIQTKATIELFVGEKINLNWKNFDNETLIIEFFNNKGERLFEEEVSVNSYDTDRLNSKGLYYWKLLNADFDLLFCGKIIVK